MSKKPQESSLAWLTDGGAWLKSICTDWVMVCFISTEFSWLSVFSGHLKWYSVFRNPVYRVDPQSSRTGRASRQLGPQWLSLLLSSQNHLCMEVHFSTCTTQPKSSQCFRTVERYGRGMKHDRWNQTQLNRSCRGSVDN